MAYSTAAMVRKIFGDCQARFLQVGCIPRCPTNGVEVLNTEARTNFYQTRTAVSTESGHTFRDC